MNGAEIVRRFYYRYFGYSSGAPQPDGPPMAVLGVKFVFPIVSRQGQASSKTSLRLQLDQVSGLSSLQRQVLLLRFDDCTFGEIARALHLAEADCQRVLNNAFEIIRRHFVSLSDED